MQNSYLPFGMVMPGRKFEQNNGINYRYSINGQERSDELNSNLTTALYWEYDSRIGRRWNEDPKGNIWESPYSCFGGNPIGMADPNGDVYLPKNATVNYLSSKGPGDVTSTRDDPANVIGIWGHTAMSRLMNGPSTFNPFGNYDLRWSTNAILNNGLKPDLIDTKRKIVWELKPISYYNHTNKSNKANKQIDRYVKEINEGGLIAPNVTVFDKFQKGGTLADVPFPDGTTTENMGYQYKYTIPDPSTGIIYYEVTNRKKQKETKSANSAVKVPTKVSANSINPSELIQPTFKLTPEKNEKQRSRKLDPWKLIPVPIIRILDLFLSPVDWDGVGGTQGRMII